MILSWRCILASLRLTDLKAEYLDKLLASHLIEVVGAFCKLRPQEVLAPMNSKLRRERLRAKSAKQVSDAAFLWKDFTYMNKEISLRMEQRR